VVGGHWPAFEVAGSRGSRIGGFQLIPHLGLFVTDDLGPSWLRGSLELLVEPTYLHLDTRESDNHAGLSVLGRWVFAGEGRVRWYVEAGGGAVGGGAGGPQTVGQPALPPGGGGGGRLFSAGTHARGLRRRFRPP